jgi:inhibitor of cysteine peptidase
MINIYLGNEMNQKRISIINSIAVILIAALIVGGGIYLIYSRGRVEEINLGPEDNGRTLDVRVGTIVVIKIPENPTTGYRWQYTVNKNILEVMDDNYVGPEDPIPGRGSTRMLKLRVAGSGEFAMDYARSWENLPIDHFSVSFLCG